MAAGLAPGQVRTGLRLLGRVLDAMDDFCRLLGKELFLVEPLFYHSALLYERHGCDYLLGRDLMETIDSEFRPEADSIGHSMGPRSSGRPVSTGRSGGGAGPSTMACWAPSTA